MTALVFYLLLFLALGIFFVFFHLMLGKMVRPAKPDPEKLTIYECGEPTIGSSWIQFDLRFYVVALLFVIFDVEVVFFFPWAVVFGKANALAATREVPQTEQQQKEYAELMHALVPRYAVEPMQLRGRETPPMQKEREQLLNRYSVAGQQRQALSPDELQQNRAGGSQLAWLAFWDILVFFGVLLVGFAYLWRRGDLDWVRSTAAEMPAATTATVPPAAEPATLVGAGQGSSITMQNSAVH